MSVFTFRPITPGEALLHLIQDELVAQVAEVAKTDGVLLGSAARITAILDFSRGMICLNLLARLVKKAHRVMEIDDASLHQRAFVDYLQLTLGLVERGDGVLDDIARQSLEAARASGRTINSSVKRIVLGGHKEVGCYLCGAMCNEESVDINARVSYDHIWPSSYGGDSIVDNLLPACHWCNNKKDDMLLWHTGALFTFVLKPYPSIEERKAVERREKIARRMQDILDRANSSGSTLKEAAIALGPAKFKDWSVVEQDDAVDYFNLQFS